MEKIVEAWKGVETLANGGNCVFPQHECPPRHAPGLSCPKELDLSGCYIEVRGIWAGGAETEPVLSEQHCGTHLGRGTHVQKASGRSSISVPHQLHLFCKIQPRSPITKWDQQTQCGTYKNTNINTEIE